MLVGLWLTEPIRLPLTFSNKIWFVVEWADTLVLDYHLNYHLLEN